MKTPPKKKTSFRTVKRLSFADNAGEPSSTKLWNNVANFVVTWIMVGVARRIWLGDISDPLVAIIPELLGVYIFFTGGVYLTNKILAAKFVPRFSRQTPDEEREEEVKEQDYQDSLPRESK